jgi:hypothetical protein
MTRINDNGVDREMTAAEKTAYDQFVAECAVELAKRDAAKNAVIAAKASARDKLKALGLSDDEIAALVG